MSDSLDKLFRDHQSNVPPATPPPGQWARIWARQPVLATVANGSLVIWKITTGLFIGLGAAAGAYYLSGKPVVEGEVSALVSDAEIVDVYPNADKNAVVGVLATSFAPASAPNKLVKQASNVTSELPAYSTKGADVNWPVVDAEKAVATPDLGRNASPGKPGGANTDASRLVLLARQSQTLLSLEDSVSQATASDGFSPDLANGLSLLIQPEQISVTTGMKKHLVSAPVSVLPATGFTVVQTMYSDSLTSARISGSGLMPLNPVKTITRAPVQLARWEAGLHVTPLVSGSRTDVYTYAEESNGSSPRSYNFGNRTVNLYREDNVRQEIPRRFQVWIVSFELARQFSNGLRAGIGMAWLPPKVDGLIEHGEVLTNELSPGQWATNFTSEREYVLTTAQLDYTFYRRRRFRPYLGVMLSYELYTNYRSMTNLFERSSGTTEVVSTSYASRYPGDNGLLVLPRIGFQYDLNERISIGTEIMPGFGIGGRWKW